MRSTYAFLLENGVLMGRAIQVRSSLLIEMGKTRACKRNSRCESVGTPSAFEGKDLGAMGARIGEQEEVHRALSLSGGNVPPIVRNINSLS